MRNLQKFSLRFKFYEKHNFFFFKFLPCPIKHFMWTECCLTLHCYIIIFFFNCRSHVDFWNQNAAWISHLSSDKTTPFGRIYIVEGTSDSYMDSNFWSLHGQQHLIVTAYINIKFLHGQLLNSNVLFIHVQQCLFLNGQEYLIHEWTGISDMWG